MKIGVVGAGFSGLAAAGVLAKEGYDVDVFEKHDRPGGRARQYETDGFVFDMGPSWYWMPDIFERYFERFGKTPADYYTLEKLDPGFRMFFDAEGQVDVPGSYPALRELFESRQKSGADRLDRFMREAEYKYKVGMDHLVYKPSESWMEFVTPDVVKGVFRLDIATSIRKHVRKYFTDPALVAIMEFPILFLGAMPDSTPALYSLMNYAGLKVGTFYPRGGFGEVVKAMESVAVSHGARIHYNSEIQQVGVESGQIRQAFSATNTFDIDALISSADYHHFDQNVLPHSHRQYSAEYWDSRVLAPSCLLFYLGVDKEVPGLLHHNLFFDADLDNHAEEIYRTKQWPSDPLFYVCCPSKTDPTVAPAGKENLFVLVPIAPGLEDSEDLREKYFDIVMSRIEKHLGTELRESLIYKRSYCVEDFKNDYHALKGNAYGLANTLRQTAVLKPRIRGKSIKNLFFTGHLTVPGPGVPPAIISGQIAATMLSKSLNPYDYATHL